MTCRVCGLLTKFGSNHQYILAPLSKAVPTAEISGEHLQTTKVKRLEGDVSAEKLM